MENRRYVVECGELLHRRVGKAPDAEPGDFLSRTEAALHIIAEMDGAIALARESRRNAMRVIRDERKKGVFK